MPSLFRRAIHEWQFYFSAQGLERAITPTLFRVRVLSSGIAISHILFGFLMSTIDPQPFENMHMRAGLAVLALLLVWQTYGKGITKYLPRLTLARSFSWSIWLHLDLFSLWMYAMNGCNSIWLAYCCTSIMMGFLLMKWRQALHGLMLALALTPLLAMATHAPRIWPSLEHISTLTLATVLSLLYAWAMGNAREQHLRQSLAITGLVQTRINPSINDLREKVAELTPLAQVAQPAASSVRLLSLQKVFLQSLDSMQHELQMQRNNAQMLGLNGQIALIDAQELLTQTLSDYPYRSPSQQRCVQVRIDGNFYFWGNRAQWQQAISNLLKNSLDSLYHTKLHFNAGDLCCYVRTRGAWGRISIQDHGLPISPQALPHVFDPFFSSGPVAGLGLGLPFCSQLAHKTGGHIGISSDAIEGTVVHIYLPLAESIPSADQAQAQQSQAAEKPPHGDAL